MHRLVKSMQDNFSEHFLILYLLATFPLSLSVSASAGDVANVGTAVIAHTNTIIF